MLGGDFIEPEVHLALFFSGYNHVNMQYQNHIITYSVEIEKLC